MPKKTPLKTMPHTRECLPSKPILVVGIDRSGDCALIYFGDDPLGDEVLDLLVSLEVLVESALLNAGEDRTAEAIARAIDNVADLEEEGS